MAALPPAFGAATAPNAADAGNAKQLYETAYGYLMQRDDSAAQGSFEDFRIRSPQDLLAGDAEYWLANVLRARRIQSALVPFSRATRTTPATRALLTARRSSPCRSTGWAERRGVLLFGELVRHGSPTRLDAKMRAKSERQRIGCT